MGRPKELTEEERQELLAQGWRPLEVWVIDRDSEAYRAEAARQAKSAAEADLRDGEIDDWLAHVQAGIWDDETP